MSTNYYITEKKECNGCANRGLYFIDNKGINQYHCYHPSRPANPSIKQVCGKRKPCKLIRGE